MRALVLAALVLSALAPPATARYKNFDCVFQHGPRYTWAINGGDERWQSTTYIATGFGTTCSFAKKWIGHLAKEPYSGGKRPRRGWGPLLPHGPQGWRCESKFISPNLKPLTSYAGVCQNRRDPRRVFDWGPQSGYDDGPVNPPKPPPDELAPELDPAS